MKYYKNPNGEVYAYETESERQEWGAPELVELTPEELHLHLNPPPQPPTADELRAQRDLLLLKADHEINKLEDSGQDSSEWRKYRQALRDVPQQKKFPKKVNWPEEPKGESISG